MRLYYQPPAGGHAEVAGAAMHFLVAVRVRDEVKLLRATDHSDDRTLRVPPSVIRNDVCHVSPLHPFYGARRDTQTQQ